MEKKEPIRILHVLQRMEAGGTQALLMNIYRNIDRSKVQFDFLVEYPSKQFYDDEIISLGGKIYYTNVRNDYNILKFEHQLKKILKENNYNIIHVHAYTIGYFVLKTAKKCGVPVRIAHSHSNNMTNDLKKVLKKILQKIYPIYANEYMACSKEAGKYLFKNKNYIVINNAIDSSKFIFSEEIRLKKRKELGLENSFVIGHVGRFKPEKNHVFLLNVFCEVLKRCPNAKLLLIGNGDPNFDILKKIEDLNIKNNVIILKNRKDVNELYQAMDVFVFPSLFEGLGIVAVEAQASGTPVLCSDKLPSESNISPLFKSLSLNESIETWAENAINQTKNAFKHKNMQKYVVDAGYEIKDLAQHLQAYYINK